MVAAIRRWTTSTFTVVLFAALSALPRGSDAIGKIPQLMKNNFLCKVYRARIMLKSYSSNKKVIMSKATLLIIVSERFGSKGFIRTPSSFSPKDSY